LLRLIVFPLGRPYVVPSDRLGHEVASVLIAPSASRDRLTAGAYVTRSEADAIGVLELGLEARAGGGEIFEARIKPAVKAGTLAGKSIPELAQAALAQSLITSEEHAVFVRAKRLADEAIRVDHFPQDLGLSAMRSAHDALERVAA